MSLAIFIREQAITLSDPCTWQTVSTQTRHMHRAATGSTGRVVDHLDDGIVGSESLEFIGGRHEG